ncbi:MAG: 5'-methylthioadenosine/S-adenosylhomocysteine nucleosidase [Bacilli bacterium]|nr:5'-methylthioadenosine/S-adenosylhomocysteine nucleosidase [Bacilli bacterium]
MKTTVVVFPMEEEMNELLPKLKKFKKVSYGMIDGVEFEAKRAKVFAFVSGIGKAKIGLKIGYLASRLDIAEIYNVGVAGSLVENIVPLNVVVATKVGYYDIDITGDGKYQLGQMAHEPMYFEADKENLNLLDKLNTTLTIRKGTIISGDSFATKTKMTKEFLKNFDNPLLVDMESAAVGQCAHDLDIPFTIIRGVSDYVFADDNGSAFEEYLYISARRAASVLLHLIDDPFIG